jgi:hypothetical protein
VPGSDELLARLPVLDGYDIEHPDTLAGCAQASLAGPGGRGIRPRPAASSPALPVRERVPGAQSQQGGHSLPAGYVPRSSLAARIRPAQTRWQVGLNRYGHNRKI